MKQLYYCIYALLFVSWHVQAMMIQVTPKTPERRSHETTGLTPSMRLLTAESPQTPGIKRKSDAIETPTKKYKPLQELAKQLFESPVVSTQAKPSWKNLFTVSPAKNPEAAFQSVCQLLFPPDSPDEHEAVQEISFDDLLASDDEASETLQNLCYEQRKKLIAAGKAFQIAPQEEQKKIIAQIDSQLVSSLPTTSAAEPEIERFNSAHFRSRTAQETELPETPSRTKMLNLVQFLHQSSPQTAVNPLPFERPLIDLEHIYVQQATGGYHFENKAMPVTVTEGSKDSGVYGGLWSRSNKGNRSKFSTFFPQNSSQKTIVDAVHEAYYHPIAREDNRLLGMSSLGIIEMSGAVGNKVQQDGLKPYPLLGAYQIIVGENQQKLAGFTPATKNAIAIAHKNFSFGQIVALAAHAQQENLTRYESGNQKIFDLGPFVGKDKKTRGIYVALPFQHAYQLSSDLNKQKLPGFSLISAKTPRLFLNARTMISYDQVAKEAISKAAAGDASEATKELLIVDIAPELLHNAHEQGIYVAVPHDLV